jgi:hypothetical protein
MLLKKQVTEKYIEALFDSTNLFKTVYNKQKKILYVFFRKGGVVSYLNISPELYEEFENTSSQGEFVSRRIQKNPTAYPFRKEYKMKLFEIENLTNEIDKLILEMEDDD